MNRCRKSSEDERQMSQSEPTDNKKRNPIDLIKDQQIDVLLLYSTCPQSEHVLQTDTSSSLAYRRLQRFLAHLSGISW